MTGVHEGNPADSDEALLDRVRGGDLDAFAPLLQRHQKAVFGVVSRHVPSAYVAEVAHDAMVDAYRALPRFRGDCAFGTWLCRIAIRRSYDFWRARRHDREAVPLDEAAGEQQRWLDQASAAVSAAEQERLAAGAEARELLDRVLGRLGPEDRMIVTLLHLEDQPVREIAQALGWSAVRVKVRALRARRALRRHLEALRGGKP